MAHRWVTLVLVLLLVTGRASLGWGQQSGTFRHPTAKLPSPRHPLLAPQVLRGFFRPTVTIKNGSGRGSGTIVASTPGSTWILTAAHVVAPGEELVVELQPYNFGVEKGAADRRSPPGPWPRLVPAELVASDASADVAYVRIKGQPAFPFVAHLDLGAAEPTPDDVLTSIGVVGGKELTGWRTDIQGQVLLDLAKLMHKESQGEPRRFTVTTKPPEFGRSGGALFRPDGRIVGVAVGRLRIENGPEIGVFASMSSIRQLAQSHRIDAVLVPTAARR